MILKYVNCIVRSLSKADHIVERLKFAEFSRNDISLLFLSKLGSGDVADENAGNNRDKGALNWLGGFGTLTIPAIGCLTAAGPFLTLSSKVRNGSLENISTALACFGMPDLEAKRYGQQIEQGGIWFSVVTRGLDEVSRAQWIFEDAGVEDLATTKETKSTPGSLRRNSSTSGLVPKRYRGKRFGRLFFS